MEIPNTGITWIVWLVVVLTVSVALALAFIDASVGWFSSQKSHELALQFVLITAIGGVGLLWLQQYQKNIENQRAADARELERQRERAEKAAERERVAREQKRQLLNAYQFDLVRMYNEAKRIRRALRAKSRWDGKDRRDIDRIDYESLMAALEDVQLRLEQAVREIDIQPDLFGSDGKAIEKELKSAEEYLRDVVRDYEQGGHVGPVQAGLMPLPQNVYEFMAPRDERRLHQLPKRRKHEFQNPIREVRKKIVTIINVTLTAPT